MTVLLSLICLGNSVVVLFGQAAIAKSGFDMMKEEVFNVSNQDNRSVSDVGLDGSNIFLSGLGGAIFGAVFTSILQNYLLKRGNSNKEHFSDLKEEIVNPIIKSISKTSESDFFCTDLSELFKYYQMESNIVIEIKNILTKDFFDHHYPQIYTLLLNSLNLYNNLNKKRGKLVEKLELDISNKFSTLSKSDDEIYNTLSVKNIRDSIFEGKYNDAFIRSTSAEGSAYIYFSQMDNYLIPFGDEREEFTILQIRGDNIQRSKERAEEIMSEIMINLQSIVKENKKVLENYRSEETSFQTEKDRLLTELRSIKYSTSIKNLRNHLLRKKCIFLK